MLIWDKYLKCKQYVDARNVVAEADKCFDFYIGDQWRHCESGGEVLPFHNIIKPTVKFKVSTVCQNKVTATYTDKDNTQENKHIYDFMNKQFAMFREHGKFDVKLWEVNRNAAIYGDAYMYWGTKNPSVTQVLPTGTILFGDEQCPEIQKQPYIIIRQRVRVSDVRDEARRNGIPEDEIDGIMASDENDFLVGNKENVKNDNTDAKVTAIIYLEKKNGVVHMAKAVENCEYRPLAPLAQKDAQGKLTKNAMTLYPIAHLPWEKVPNSARNKGAVGELIANQIAINVSLAQRKEAIKMSAFPRLAYDGQAIQNEEDIDAVGAKIRVNGNAMQSIQQQISYLAPQPLSSDAKVFTDELINTTKELSGTSDTITGAIDPTRVSAAAITALRDQAAQSLNENVTANNQFVEDSARIVFDLIVTYANGIEEVEVSDEKGGNKIIEITPDDLSRVQPYIKIDVTPETASTKKSIEDWWSEMLEKQHVSFEEYVEGVPSGGSVPKEQAQAILEKRGETNGLPEMQDEPVIGPYEENW
jgi:hypothetical protein